MSRTVRGSAGVEKDWWAKRPLSSFIYHSHRPRITKFWKKLLHKIERRQGKEKLNK